MRKLHTLTAGALLLALAACGDRKEADAPGEAPAASAPGKAASITAPKLRAGLWRVSMTGEGPQSTASMCLNDAVQERMNVVGAQNAGGNCQPTAMTPNPGGGWRYRSVCDYSAMGGGTSVSEGVMTGDLTTGYTSRTTVTTTGAQVAHMNRAVTITGQGVYAGPCPADMKPGDMVIAGGMKFNMLEMAEMAAKMETPRPAG